jgi:uncharacterized membrane protein
VTAGARRVSLFGPPTLSGLTLGVLAWLAASTPTLIPRSWAVQAGVSGVSFAIGYGIGTFIGHVSRPLLERWDRSRRTVSDRRGLAVLASIALLGVLIGTIPWIGWQNTQRELMGLAPLGWIDAVLMVVASAVVGGLLVLVGRAIAKLIAALDRSTHRHAPAGLATAVTVAVTAAVVAVGGVVAARGVAAAAGAFYGDIDQGTNEGIVVPGAATVSGSSGSLVAWETLGRWGREFVATATTADEIAAFHGADVEAVDPVRVFVGLRSAGSSEERAQLAVRELERAGGFDRAVLAVWVPTGSGWVIPEAATALEQLYRGDTAIAAMQYSFLPSLFSVFIEPGRADEAAEDLFAAVQARWTQLPPDQRPMLVVFGKSLGAAGAEAPFAGADATASVANLVARTDGALVVGAPRDSPILSQLTRERDEGSPVWQPVFDGGRSVRFLNRDPDQPPLATDWSAPRVVYLQHPSDPPTFWGFDAIWRPPEWMDLPRGFDVPDAARWFPVVSAVQAVADMIFQLSTPPGFGHVYADDYVAGWAQVIPPEGWTDADTARLTDFLYTGHGESEP